MNVLHLHVRLGLILAFIIVFAVFSKCFIGQSSITLLSTKKSEQIIPRRIIQTNNRYTEVFHENLSFKRRNPHYIYLFYNNSEADKFVRDHMSKTIWQAYQLMPKRILKVDYFRYIVIYVLGGFYSDFDTECLRPIDTWTDNQHPDHVGFMVGIEAESPNWQRDYARPLQLCQWTFGAVPHHPILKRLIDRIAAKILIMQNVTVNTSTVLNWTGPGMWTDVIFDYLNETYHIEWTSFKHLEQARLIGDVYILPITAFQPSGFDMGAKGPTHPDARISHHFSGSWKNLLVK